MVELGYGEAGNAADEFEIVTVLRVHTFTPARFRLPAAFYVHLRDSPLIGLT